VPATVDAAKISAAYKEGVLTVTMPQREDARPKQITVGE
jgi:HSP20 family protein